MSPHVYIVSQSSVIKQPCLRLSVDNISRTTDDDGNGFPIHRSIYVNCSRTHAQSRSTALERDTLERERAGADPGVANDRRRVYSDRSDCGSRTMFADFAVMRADSEGKMSHQATDNRRQPGYPWHPDENVRFIVRFIRLVVTQYM